MKSCPTCKRTYADDTITFCLVDGAILSAPYDPQATRPYDREPPPTLEISNSAAKTDETLTKLSSRPTYKPDTAGASSKEKRSGKRVLLVGLAVALLLATGLIIGANWKTWFGRGSSQAKEAMAGNTSDKATPQPTPSIAPSVTPQGTPSPKATPSPAKKIDMRGTWTGTFANRDAVLFINSQNGDSFSGILKNSKGAIVAVSGLVNSETQRISMQENRVVEQVKEGPEWVLGTNTGWVSADGQRLNGSGKDKAGHAYTFTFTKD